MACFCHMAAESVRQRFTPSAVMALPPTPLQMRMAAAIPNLGPADRPDLEMRAAVAPIAAPSVNLGGGPLAQMAVTLGMAAGNFSLDDVPALEAELEQAAQSFQRNVWPRLAPLASLKMQPLLNYAIAARLCLDLSAMGLDPMTATAGDIPPPPATSDTRFALTPPQLAKARLLAGLPPVAKLSETLNTPPLGDTGAMQALNNRLANLSRVSPPSMAVPLPMVLKLAMVLESLAKIEEAFGDDPLSPSTMGRVDAMMKTWATFPVPMPVSSLALNEKLAALPPLEAVKLGEHVAGQSWATGMAAYAPPKLAIAPFLNAMLALNATLHATAAFPPLGPCGACNS